MTTQINSLLTFHNTDYVEDLFDTGNGNRFGVLEIHIPREKISNFEWDIIFSIDSSGSMSDLCSDNRSKLTHIKHTISNILRLFASNRDAIFNVYIQTFDDVLNEVFNFTKITEENKEELIENVNKIFPGCSTNLCLPLNGAYAKYKERKISHPNNKFIHIELTDGDDTCGNNMSKLKETLCNDYKNIFIGFGKEHNSILLNTLASNNINEYRYIDKLESAGLIYGEIVHNMLYMVYENVQIEIQNGEIYNWRTNEWTTTLMVGSISSGLDKTFHIRSGAPSHTIEGFIYEVVKNEKTKLLDEIYELPELMDDHGHSVDIIDHTKYMFRQKTQEMLYISKNKNCKKELKSFYEKMTQYIKDKKITDTLFWKVLLDDIYIVYKTVGTEYSYLYSNSRQISQGMQQTYAVNNIDEIKKCIHNRNKRNRRNTSIKKYHFLPLSPDMATDGNELYEQEENSDDDYEIEHTMLDNTQTTYSNNELLEVMRSVSNVNNNSII